MYNLLIPLLLAGACPSLVRGAACSPPWHVGQMVSTTSGRVHGHAASGRSEVSEYLGIPYAKPPVGKLRFQPPVGFQSSKDINGDNFGHACIPSNISGIDDHVDQNLVDKYGITKVGVQFMEEITAPTVKHSEDCLTLNIWTKPQTGDRDKAVMVYIHGGSFVQGSTALPSYNGKVLADEEDVVIVTINYRLSIFGFPGDPLSHANPGLLDQRRAIEWVRDNIAAFGGDPSRITLFGQSAGGVSIDDYSRFWNHDPIVAGLILQSGTSTGIGIRTEKQGRALWFQAANELGCNKTCDGVVDQGHVHRCMLRRPAKDIQKALINTVDSPITMPYCPTIDDNTVFSNDTHRTPAKLPMLIGNTDFEGGLFELFVDRPLPPGFWDKNSDDMFVCPAAERAALSAAQKNPTWRYRYFGDFPNMKLSTRPSSKAYHEAEVRLLFDTVPQNSDKGPSTPEQIALGKYIRGAWTAFAKDPVNGLRKFDDWPEYDPDKKSLIRLGYKNRVGTNLAIGKKYDKGC